MKCLFTCLLFLFSISNHIAQEYDDYLGAGHTNGITITSSHEESPANLCMNGNGLGKNLQEASRFLSQATLGANLGEIIYADSIGFENWINQQFQIPPSSHAETLEELYDVILVKWIEAGLPPEDLDVSTFFSRAAWWHVSTQTNDQLRHKIALALSELLVISDQSDLEAFGKGLAHYYDILSKNAFGNYRDLLMDVTLNPCMGFYLSHINNPRSFPQFNIHPDENYAREIMQLFSIGLYELNQDGTRKLDTNGLYIPTYDNDDIRGLAKIFTGLSIGEWVSDEITEELQFGIPFYYADLTVPMIMYDDWHEPGPKEIVGNYLIPAGFSGMRDIEIAVEHLFNHSNVGPFLGKHFIQRLVKSNPTPAYVKRVAQAFEDNGNGERGDLKAVIKAVLLDPEARNCIWVDEISNGKLREPIHRYTQLLRTFQAETNTDYFINMGYNFQYLTGQHPLSSPTVFNFFLPGYQPNGEIADAMLVAPEFQIFNSSTSIGYINLLQYWLFADYLNELPGILDDDSGEWKAFLTADELDFIGEKTSGLVDYLDLVLGHGNLSEETKRTIIQFSAPFQSALDRIKVATFLTMLSPDFAIMK
jgi:uncharacterized protein (DUF1800 family)